MNAAIKEFTDKVSSKDRDWPKLIPLRDPKDDLLRLAWIELFLSQRERTWRDGKNVAVVFETDLQAEEFHKLLRGFRKAQA